MRNDQLASKYTYALFIMALGIFLFMGLKDFFSAFLGAVVFYTLFKKFMIYLTRVKGLKTSLAAVIIIVISFLIVVLPVTILVTVIVNKIAAIASQPELIAQSIDKLTLRLEQLPFEVSTSSLKEGAQAAITNNVGMVLNSSLSILGSILMMYFFLFFLLTSVNRMEAAIVHYLPFRRAKVMLFGRELVDQTYSNAIGVPLVCIAQGFLAYLSYLLAGVPEAGLWGILTGFASIIPLVGTAIIWVPVTLFLLADQKNWQAVFVAAYSIVIMSNVDNLIRMVVSRKIGHVHPVTTVLGVIIGLEFFGLPGLVFGPLIISYFIILLKLYYLEYIKTRNVPEPVAAREKDMLKVFLDYFNLFNTRQARKKGKKP